MQLHAVLLLNIISYLWRVYGIYFNGAFLENCFSLECENNFAYKCIGNGKIGK